MEQKHKILIVDDAEINRSLLADMLAEQYSVVEAANGREAISILEKQHLDISLILLDIMMPEVNGFEVLAYMGKSDWLSSIPVIMISAETSSSYIDQAYDLGATDFISRPFDEKTVKRRVNNTIMLYAKQKNLETMVAEQILEKEHNAVLMVEILSNIVEFRNGESGLHVLHIRAITGLLLRHLCTTTDRYRLSPDQISMIVNASSLHDIGKISIPEPILNKPGKLTPEEFEIIKTHSAIGAQILGNALCGQNEDFIKAAHDICRWHHERYDGHGYPDGLKGDETPISAQVVALADVYDALTSKRVYKEAYTHETAMRMILNGECGAFNPVLLQCFIEAAPQIAQELSSSTAEQISSFETSDISAHIFKNDKASSRTLALLEQERTKFQFFTSLSREILFEYSLEKDVLTFSALGILKPELDEIIPHPIGNAALTKVIPLEDILCLYSSLQKATPENPTVQQSIALNIHGTPRWHNVIARPLWSEDEAQSITGIIGKILDVHKEHLQIEALKKRAERDSLTELHNHKSARKRIETILSQVHDEQYALLLLDLDQFKSINDQYGHMFGDAVLKDVARRIAENMRKGDIASRIGGDEFLIFIACRNDALSDIQHLFHAIGGEYSGIQISLSIGVSSFPKDGRNYETLFHQADQALYAAKHRGRNQYCFFDSSVTGTLSVLSPMENEL